MTVCDNKVMRIAGMKRVGRRKTDDLSGAVHSELSNGKIGK